jgi:hypothetical protein
LNEGPHDYGFFPWSCREACAEYPYFSLQNGGWCACGHKFGLPETTYPAIDDAECHNTGGAYQGGPWANAVFSNELYIERDIYTPDDSRWYTYGCEAQQQLVKGNNRVFKTFKVHCLRNIHLGLWQGPDGQGKMYEIWLS